jgi:hypothetical protein
VTDCCRKKCIKKKGEMREGERRIDRHKLNITNGMIDKLILSITPSVILSVKI